MFSRGYDTSKVATQNGTKVVGWQEQSVARAFISPFGLDKYEVTVGRFRPFFNIYESWIAQRPVSTGEMHAGAPPHLPASGWNRDWSRDRTKYPGTKQELQDRLDSCNMSRLARPEDRIVGWLEDAAGTNDQKPMTCVGFYEALLFCIWDEGRLPTEAEWNFAAAGGALQQAYPWGTPGQDKFVGNPVETDRANVGPNTSTLGLREVGSFATGGGLWGHQDLAGNAYEWVHDTCQQDCAEYNVAMMAEPLEVTPGSRIVRGGSYLWGPVNARTAYRKRVADGIAVRYEDVGWRCARNLVRP